VSVLRELKFGSSEPLDQEASNKKISTLVEGYRHEGQKSFDERGTVKKIRVLLEHLKGKVIISLSRDEELATQLVTEQMQDFK
jgi:hypothetical protein